MRILFVSMFAAFLAVGAQQAQSRGLTTHASRAPRTGASCPPQGSAKSAKTQALNVQKARTTEPTAADLDPEISLEALLNEGDDTGRFDATQAAEITGYVIDVKVGGVETANCGAKDPAHRDTHIELALSPDAPETSRVIVEVTPRWRRKMAGTDDWSTDTLTSTIKNKWITVQGWMLFDFEHANQAVNTSPGNASNWRATVWEIHPITAMTILDGPPNAAIQTGEAESVAASSD